MQIFERIRLSNQTGFIVVLNAHHRALCRIVISNWNSNKNISHSKGAAIKRHYAKKCYYQKAEILDIKLFIAVRKM